MSPVRRGWLELGVLGVSMLVTGLTGKILKVMSAVLPEILHATETDLRRLSATCLFLFAAMMLSTGRTGEWLGRTRAAGEPLSAGPSPVRDRGCCHDGVRDTDEPRRGLHSVAVLPRRAGHWNPRRTEGGRGQSECSGCFSVASA